MLRRFLTILAVWGIMVVIPFPIYGALSAFTGLEPPTEGTAFQFVLSVVVVKIGVALAFVLLYTLAQNRWAERWWLYAFVWWIMFAVMELGQAIVPDYSWLDAIGGIIAEAIYFPLSALIVVKLTREEHIR